MHQTHFDKMPGVTFIPQPTGSLMALLRLLEYASPVPRMNLGGYTQMTMVPDRTETMGQHTS